MPWIDVMRTDEFIENALTLPSCFGVNETEFVENMQEWQKFIQIDRSLLQFSTWFVMANPTRAQNNNFKCYSNSIKVLFINTA